MNNRYGRDIDSVTDVHGREVKVGTDCDAVTVGDFVLGPEVRGDFFRLAFQADAEAKAWGEAQAREAQAREAAEEADAPPFGAPPPECDAGKFGEFPSVLDGRCRCMVCGRCGHHSTNNHQGHYWTWCSVTKSMRKPHFCCKDPAFGCELEQQAEQPAS